MVKVADDVRTPVGRRRAALQREAHLQQVVRHPGIVAVEAEATVGGSPALVFALAEHPPVLDRAPARPWSAPEIGRALADLAEALDALHRAGVVHGDVSTTNVVFFDRSGAEPPRAALIDFGSAEWVDVPATRPARPGTRWGTPGSVAPEVVAGAPVGPAADRYGLGAVGLHWLDLAEPSASEAGGRERLTATCTALTAFEPTARPSDLAAVAALLREAAGPLEETDPPRPAAATSSPRVRTVEFGPRPERVVSPEVATTADHQVRRSLVVAAMVLVGSLIGVRATHHAPRRSTGLQRSAPSRSCAPGQGAGPLEPGRPRLVDLDGDGCARRVVWQPPRLAVARAPDPAGRSPVAPRRFRLGRAGDRLAIGALGCAARPELVLYRPSTGELFAYPSLPDPDRGTPVVHPEHRRSGVRNGRLSIDRGPDGCERLVVAGKATS